MPFSQLLLINVGVVATMMLTIWLISLWLSDVSVVDIGWGTGFAVVACVTYALSNGGERATWLLILTTLWGLRLSGYLAWRNVGKPEDYRYRAMREKRGPGFRFSSLYIVFGLQGAIMWVVSLPVQHGIAGPASGQAMLWWNVLGVAAWLIGFGFESLGDYQLARFKSNPANQGKVFDQGLWHYTRHPNYFGDFMVWWGLFLVSMHTWHDLWTIISPLIMSFLLIKVSGVALLDRTLKNRSPEHAEYMRTTSGFFPWRPTSRG